ncbi:hypothetical protein [Halococcus saccharolyticus]|uniref:Uncharacterized protein n=1 Tax=Halococcus saccharolyticus DSM 5350 TaxID=1227455 RepID=M0MU40_9EURY|nr:hypothetical protein [Halococcus saccharolyticus]EMA47965.1 hypothetical protein C449_00795 [Halococcus saccharolyticus DSM 5350]
MSDSATELTESVRDQNVRRPHERVKCELPRWVLTETIAFAEVVERDRENPNSLRESAGAVQKVLDRRLTRYDADCTCGPDEACDSCPPDKFGQESADA